MVPAGLACLVSAAPATASFPGRNGKIAYAQSMRDTRETPTFDRAIAAVDSRGNAGQRLRGCRQAAGQPDKGDCTIEYLTPSYSASGARVVFDTGGALAVMDSDGANFRRLMRLTAADAQPSWSPGDSRLLFTGRSTSGAAGPRDLYTASPTGGSLRRLTYRGGEDGAWSAKGVIAFTRTRGNQSDVYLVRADGRGLRRLTFHGGSEPAWSPHGTKIAFVRNRSVYAVGADGRGLRRLVVGGSEPEWSPDGGAIAFDRVDEGISVVRTDGHGLRLIAVGGSGGSYRDAATDPTWQPVH